MFIYLMMNLLKQRLLLESTRSFQMSHQVWKADKINPLVSEPYPIERAHEAIAKLENRGAIGKLVVTME